MGHGRMSNMLCVVACEGDMESEGENKLKTKKTIVMNTKSKRKMKMIRKMNIRGKKGREATRIK